MLFFEKSNLFEIISKILICVSIRNGFNFKNLIDKISDMTLNWTEPFFTGLCTDRQTLRMSPDP